MNSFQLGETPWIRSYLREQGRLRCPFCGDETQILSMGDVPTDDLRIEVYCDNQLCDVRTATIIAMNIGEPNERADVEALLEVDRQRGVLGRGQDHDQSP